jgi:hypothetical protein
MVMNPNLIPHTVNIVIGEGLYKLKFWVELNVEETKQQPMDMDDNHEDDGSVIEGIMTLLIMRSRRQPVLKRPGGSLNNVKKVNSATGKQVAQATPFFSFRRLLVWSMEEGVWVHRKFLALEWVRRRWVRRKPRVPELVCRS